jgi:hypothetical protein
MLKDQPCTIVRAQNMTIRILSGGLKEDGLPHEKTAQADPGFAARFT